MPSYTLIVSANYDLNIKVISQRRRILKNFLVSSGVVCHLFNPTHVLPIVNNHYGVITKNTEVRQLFYIGFNLFMMRFSLKKACHELHLKSGFLFARVERDTWLAEQTPFPGPLSWYLNSRRSLSVTFSVGFSCRRDLSLALKLLRVTRAL